MAEDARDTAETAREIPKTPEKKTQYTPTPPSPANEYGTRPPAATVTDAVKSIALEDFKTVHMQPCVRNSLLYGIGTGFAFGGLRLVLGGTYPLLLFIFTSIKQPADSSQLQSLVLPTGLPVPLLLLP